MKVIHEFRPGLFVQDAAKALVEMAKVTGETQRGEFNGTPIEATWHDSAVGVCERWHDKRVVK